MSFSSPSCPKVSIVVPTHNEGGNLRRTLHNLLATMPPNGEIIVVDDGSTDGSTAFLDEGYGAVRLLGAAERLGVAGARNLGAANSCGDVLVFSDAHVETPLNWAVTICEALQSPDVGVVGPAICALGGGPKGYGLTWCSASLDVQWLPSDSALPHPVPFLCGCFTAMRRDVFIACDGFDRGMTTWGSEDAEICLRLWLLGYQCLVVPAVEVGHLFRSRFPYEVEWEMVLHNLLRLAGTHFNRERFERFTASLIHHASFPGALARYLDGDASSRRAALRERRRFDDTWFFDRFGISLNSA